MLSHRETSILVVFLSRKGAEKRSKELLGDEGLVSEKNLLRRLHSVRLKEERVIFEIGERDI